ncbi:MAG: hypothetical protein OXI91_14935 [Chloroflexota bacterium]|nr:hypothetical protein [Chloroflexota bacterium]
MSQGETRTAGGPGSRPRDAGGDGTPENGGGGAVDDGAAPGVAFAQAAGQVVADVYELRLTALLNQLVRSRGYKGAGRVLGVDPRTVTASVREGMSRRVREQVERMLVEKDGAARDELEEAVGAIAEQVGGLVTQVAGLESELREGMQALGETHAQGMRRLEQRLAQGEARAAVTGGQPGPAPVTAVAPRRRYPDLVTVDAAADDEGCSATPRRWSGSGASCGTGTRPRGTGWPGLCHPGADSGSGGVAPGGARVDPAAGDGAAAGPGPGRPVELEGEGAPRLSAAASQAGAAGRFAAGAQSVAVAAGGSGRVAVGVAAVATVARRRR